MFLTLLGLLIILFTSITVYSKYKSKLNKSKSSRTKSKVIFVLGLKPLDSICVELPTVHKLSIFQN